MKLKIVLAGIGLFFAALIAVAFTVVMATDFNDYRDLVQERMKAATGRDLVIAGDVDVSFFWSPRSLIRVATTSEPSSIIRCGWESSAWRTCEL